MSDRDCPMCRRLGQRRAGEHNLVRGHLLESYFIETHPEHKLAVAKGLRGVAGAEYEAPAVPRFVERYLSEESYSDARHFLLAYELQRRLFVGEDQGLITKIRSQATRIQGLDSNFKPLRDAVHNQISASLIPRLAGYRDARAGVKTRAAIDALIADIDRLTALDDSALIPQLERLEDASLRAALEARMPPAEASPLQDIKSLAAIMLKARREGAEPATSAVDRRTLIGLNVTAAAVIQSRGNAFLEGAESYAVKQYVELLAALTDAAYGSGLLTERERRAANDLLAAALQRATLAVDEFSVLLDQVGRVVGWAQEGILLAFAEVWEAWTLLLPEVSLIGDDIVRGSPLLVMGQVLTRLEDHVLAQSRPTHQVMGESITQGVRALNPGLAKGTLRVDPDSNSYLRNEVVALPQTPAELQPAAGIATRGEGNVLSHVQLLARALGIPNIVTASEPYKRIAAQDGKEVFFVVTPGGRVYLKTAAEMTELDHAIYSEFNRNARRSADGSLAAGATKLDIDPGKLDLSVTAPLPLTAVTIADSGVRSGPKAAYLGELKSLFPRNVARGVVLPFGVYYRHYQEAKVAVPERLRGSGVADSGESLPGFVEKTYEKFFGEMIPAATSENELKEWIEPRLAVIHESITASPMVEGVEDAIKAALAEQGLLLEADPSQTVGLFVRSDTNVEDLENFNGAGLNLTLFNLRSLEDVYAGIKKVWASPFTLRSFSWRQPFIDEPLWVLPSIVILESVPSDKSGVLVTADIFAGDPDKMVVATSEGVGGAVDGTPAETLLWSPQSVELVNSYKSAWRLMLKPDGGREVVPATGRDYVLEDAELDALIAAAMEINEKLEPKLDGTGQPRPWDIEFGFANGKLWLFQTRPFVGNDEIRNLPALAALETGSAPRRQGIALDEVVK